MGAHQANRNENHKQNGRNLLRKSDAHKQVEQLRKHSTHRNGDDCLGRRQRHSSQVRTDGGPSAACHKQTCARHQQSRDTQAQSRKHANDAKRPDDQHREKEAPATQKRRPGKRDKAERNGDERAARNRDIARVGKHAVEQGKERPVHELHGKARHTHRATDKPELATGKRHPAKLAHLS